MEVGEEAEGGGEGGGETAVLPGPRQPAHPPRRHPTVVFQLQDRKLQNYRITSNKRPEVLLFQPPSKLGPPLSDSVSQERYSPPTCWNC